MRLLNVYRLARAATTSYSAGNRCRQTKRSYMVISDTLVSEIDNLTDKRGRAALPSNVTMR